MSSQEGRDSNDGVFLVIEDCLGRWLFQKRSANKKVYPAQFTLSVTGHLQEGELPMDGILRECHEELGFVLSRDSVNYLGHFSRKEPRFAIAPENPNDLAYVFHCIIDGTDKLVFNQDEIDELVWENPLVMLKTRQTTPCVLQVIMFLAYKVLRIGIYING